MRRRNMIRQQHCTAQNGQPAPGPVFPPLLSVFRLFQQELMRFQIPVPQVATQTKISNQHPAGIRDTHQIFITERIFTVPEAWRIKSRTPIIAISTPANSHRVSEGADGCSMVNAFVRTQPIFILSRIPARRNHGNRTDICSHRPRWLYHRKTIPAILNNGISAMSRNRAADFIPTSATGFPFTIMVEDAEITAPPCVVLSPSNTKPLDIEFPFIYQRYSNY